MTSFYTDLVAHVYDLWYHGQPQGDEEYFRARIAANGGLALEVACGTGRLLVPFLQQGLRVHGLDLAPAMLDICRHKARALGVEPVLFELPMQRFELPHRYRTILVPFNSFMILTDRRDAAQALECFHRHLEPNGELLVTAFIPWTDLLAPADGLWRLIRSAIDPACGDRLLCHAAATRDRANQLQTDAFRYERYRDGVLVDSAFREMTIRWYTVHELALMLERAGFTGVESTTIPKEAGADADDSFIISARRP